MRNLLHCAKLVREIISIPQDTLGKSIFVVLLPNCCRIFREARSQKIQLGCFWPTLRKASFVNSNLAPVKQQRLIPKDCNMKKYYFCLALLFPFAMNGQKADVDFGLALSTSLYSGDLSPKEFGIYLKSVGLSGGVFARMRYSRFWAFRPGLSFVSVKGNERNGGNITRGLVFRNNLVEASALVELSLFHFGYHRAKTTFGPYLVGGFAAFYNNPQYQRGDQWVSARNLGTEGQGLRGYTPPYSSIQFGTPFGIGLHMIIRDKVTIGYEFVARRTLTDYLDDVSSNTVVFGDVVQGNGEDAAFFSNPLLKNSPENYPTSYSRGGRFVDYYYLSSLTLSYRLVNVGRSKSRYLEKNACPRFY